MEQAKQTLKIIAESIQKIDSLKQQHGSLFRDIFPVLWFGNISSKKPKVVVISANPNKPDQPEDKPRIPYVTEWKKKKRDIQKLEECYNNYFFHNPSTNWFGSNNPTKEDSTLRVQGRIEDLLNGLDASFYGDKSYQAIHIDLLPFATKDSFVKIDEQLMAIEGLPQWIDQHIKDMISIIKPELIIINGISNFHFFNQCVSLNTQPYKAHIIDIKEDKQKTATIFEANRTKNIPPIIAISINMGSYCFCCPNTLNKLGEYVKKLNIF